ncbi:MAG: BrnA antitoxin family protein [bacterium]|nr:BrnA antitoxin family protein [bacterium]
MGKSDDFSKGSKNPDAARLKKTQVTIRLDEVTVAWFKTLAEKDGIPYQTLINLYLRDCAAGRRTSGLRGSNSHRTHLRTGADQGRFRLTPDRCADGRMTRSG